MIGPKGKFLLEPDDTRTHLYISTGTGIAPFISMIRETQAQGDLRETVVLHGCSYVDDLGYREELEAHVRDGTYPITYIPTISRPNDPLNSGWRGRTGRVELNVESVLQELDLRPDDTVVYICGNPDLILTVEELLINRGHPEPNVKKELYWPKGKTVPAPTG
jgi:ferredoxin--NADP+ reductase